VLPEFLFGEQPVLAVVAILPATQFVQMVCESCYFRGCRAFAAGVLRQPLFASETRKKI
jgi:Na+-translocating ferredoxin:NAD+ oxidoreductase RNF subunit RnfB